MVRSPKCWHILLAACAAAALDPGGAAAQSNSAQSVRPPAFEVASVKASEPLDPAKLMSGQQHIGVTIDAARVDLTMLTLADLIRTAYRIKSYQVSGPDWMNTERYNIVAKLAEGAPRGQIPEMLQTLLAERFGLVLHHATREEPAYALVVAKSGPKLQESPPEAAAPAGETPPAPGTLRYDASANAKGVVTMNGPSGSRVTQTTGTNGMHLDIKKTTMAALAETLARLMDRPVVDQTELKGNYDFVLDLSREELLNAARAAGVAVPSSGAALTGGLPAVAASDPGTVSLAGSLDLLGLKLEPHKLPVDVLVIDHVEKTPIAN